MSGKKSVSRLALSFFVVVVAVVMVSQDAMALGNDIVLSRFAEFDPQEFAPDGSNCVNACGEVKPNRKLFEGLSEDLGQVLGPRIGAPAETLGEAGFAVNFMTSLSFIPNEEEYWQLGVEDRNPSSSLFSGHLQVRKGLPFSFEIAGNFGYLFDSELFTLGADIKWALNEGFLYFPDLAIRGSVNNLLGSTELNMVTAGGDMSASKSFGISGVMNITPYVGYQILAIITSSRLLNAYPQDPRSPQFDRGDSGTANPRREGATTFNPEFVFEQYDTTVNRFFFGARLNVWVLSFVLEGIIADVSQASFSAGADF